MFVWAPIAIRAVTLEVCLTYRTVRTKAKMIFASQKLAELKRVLWLLAFYGLWFGCWRRSEAHNLGHGGALQNDALQLA